MCLQCSMYSMIGMYRFPQFCSLAKHHRLKRCTKPVKKNMLLKRKVSLTLSLLSSKVHSPNLLRWYRRLPWPSPIFTIFCIWKFIEAWRGPQNFGAVGAAIWKLDSTVFRFYARFRGKSADEKHKVSWGLSLATAECHRTMLCSNLRSNFLIFASSLIDIMFFIVYCSENILI